MPSLNWIGKEAVINHHKEVYYHLLKSNDGLSINQDISDGNILVHGDNLIALKSLLPYYATRIKLIYIDVPYNTGSEEWIYNDAVNDPQIRKWLGQVVGKKFEDLSRHDKWLCMMYPRLQLLKKFLNEEGFICVHIDDTENANLKLLMDEIFLSSNYVTSMYIQVRYEDKTLKRDMDFHKQVEQILVYRKSPKATPNLKKKDYSYDKFIYYFKELAEGKEIELGGKKVVVFKEDEYKLEKLKKGGSREGLKEIWASGSILDGNSSGRFARDHLEDRKEIDGLKVLYKVYGIGNDMYDYRYFTGPKRKNAKRCKYYQGVPVEKLEEFEEELPIPNFYDMAGDFGNCRHEGGVEFKSGKKPEKLVSLLIKHFTNEGDFVLDSFAGSGTTPAVAHKMNRKWVAIELGEHCYTHIVPRLTGVVKGEDKTGVSEKYNWNGGGGFEVCQLSIPISDKLGILNEKLTYENLAHYIYFKETGHSLDKGSSDNEPIIGKYRDITYILLYEQDKTTVLDTKLLKKLNQINGMKIVYGDKAVVNPRILKEKKIIFKQIPYQIEVK